MKFNYCADGFVCTSVYVDPETKEVKIENFTDDIIDRAFGVKESVTYDDVIRFFEGRTYPKERSDMRVILDVMGLKEYDPVAMCKINKGQVDGDNHWIDFKD